MGRRRRTRPQARGDRSACGGVLAYNGGIITMSKAPNTLTDNDMPQNNDGGNLVGKLG